MKLLFKVDDKTEIWSSADKRYEIQFTAKGWANMCGEDYEIYARVFTDNGWQTITNLKGTYKYALPKTYSSKEKEDEIKARQKFKSELIEMLVMFHDG